MSDVITIKKIAVTSAFVGGLGLAALGFGSAVAGAETSAADKPSSSSSASQASSGPAKANSARSASPSKAPASVVSGAASSSAKVNPNTAGSTAPKATVSEPAPQPAAAEPASADLFSPSSEPAGGEPEPIKPTSNEPVANEPATTVATTQRQKPAPKYTTLAQAQNDPTPVLPDYDPNDPTQGPIAENQDMRVDWFRKTSSGWVVQLTRKTAGPEIVAWSPQGTVVEQQGQLNPDGSTTPSGWFVFTPDEPGQNWAMKYPVIKFTAYETRDPFGPSTSIVFRSAPDLGGDPSKAPKPLDPNDYPPVGPNAKNDVMQILPSSGSTNGGSEWVIDVLQSPGVTVNASMANGSSLRREPGRDPSKARYVWSGGSGETPIVVLRAYYPDGRPSSTITYTAEAPTPEQ